MKREVVISMEGLIFPLMESICLYMLQKTMVRSFLPVTAKIPET